MELKLIIFDVDGTLYDLKSHCIPQSCTEAIRQLKRNKIRFAIASGRAHYGMGKALNDLRADYIIADSGGVIVDSGNFDWMAHAEKYPGLCTPDESYHGITYAEKFGNAGAYITKCTSQLMRDLGCVQSPQNAFILNLGLESLHVRMPRHCENAMAVAQFLEKQPQVASVSYPHLPSSPYYARAMKYMPNGGCGVVSFVLKGGRPAAEAFMKRLTLAAIETHVADARTCCLNPATSTHRQMTEEQLAVAGIPAGMVRISVGLESKDDLIADLAQALSGIEA